MTDLPTPKFHIGQIVYYPTMHDTKERLPCPDCLGTGIWTATSPAGVTHEIGCPRCGGAYLLDNVPPLIIHRKSPGTKRMTIGSVRIDTADHLGSFVQYMCTETGVGSGSIYDEHLLFTTEEQALSVATTNAAIENAEIDERPAVMAASRFSSHLISDALRNLARDAIFRAWSSARLYRSVITDHIPDNEDGSSDNDAERDLHQDLKQVDGYADTNFLDARNPVDELVTAIRLEAAPNVVAALAQFDEQTAAVFAKA